MKSMHSRFISFFAILSLVFACGIAGNSSPAYTTVPNIRTLKSGSYYGKILSTHC